MSWSQPDPQFHISDLYSDFNNLQEPPFRVTTQQNNQPAVRRERSRSPYPERRRVRRRVSSQSPTRREDMVIALNNAVRNATALRDLSPEQQQQHEEKYRRQQNALNIEPSPSGRTKKRRVLRRQSTRGKKASRIKPKRQNGSKKRKGVKTRYVQGKKKKKKMNKKSSQKQNKK
tara:strand:- start:818 stop:1339 length:522 start_codon:yes stop_codon:yes gene_type:complete